MLVWQLQEPFCSYCEPVSTLLQIQKIYFVGTNKKRDFYELWQQHKLSKTIKMSEVSMRDICINSNLNPLTKFTRAADSLSLKISSYGRSLK